MIELSVDEEKLYKFGATLKVIGIGGAGGNAVNSMISSDECNHVEFVVANTDAQALQQSPALCKVQLGAKITKGLGAGSNPELGRRAAEEDLDALSEQVINSDILFLTAGLGGGTGTGAIPVIANMAKELGILTVAVVTKPFLFEGKRRMRYAEEAIKNLKEIVDTMIVVPNQRLLEIAHEKISLLDAFALSDNVLKQAIRGISDIITKPGHINVDFADVKAIMKDMGLAVMGTGRASGADRARKATLSAISSPLLENVSINGARGVLLNVTGNVDLGLHEISEAATMIYEMVSEDANIILGSVIDRELGDDVVVTVIATGFDEVLSTQKQEKVFKPVSDSRDVSHVEILPEQKSEIVENVASVDTPSAVIEKTVIEEPAILVDQIVAQDDHVVTSGQEQSPAENISFEQALAALDQEERVLDEQPKQTVKITEPIVTDEKSVDMNDLDAPTFLRKKLEAEKAGKREHKIVR